MANYSDQKIIELIDLARKIRSEVQNIEFKDARGGSLPRSLWKSISSFSHNPEGGVIVFGMIEDRTAGTITPHTLNDIALLQEQIADYFTDSMVNAPRPKVTVLKYEEYFLVAVVVDEIPNEEKPCYKKEYGVPNGACIRAGNTDRVISMAEAKEFMRNSSLFKFDKTEAIGTRIDMLNFEKISDFLEKSAEKTGREISSDMSELAVLKNLQIANTFESGLLPTVGGFIVFSKENPQKVPEFSRYIVRCVRYGGKSAASPIVDSLDVYGTLDQQIDLMLKFVLRNIPVSASIVGTKRVEEYGYPVEAIRELIANSIIHRDYRTTETFTSISIFSDRIEISNPGNLAPGVTIENIKEAQVTRNEVIANILKDMNYLEEYGRGIDIVFSRMEEMGLLEPVFKNVANTFKVTLLGKSFTGLNSRQIKIWQSIQEKNNITTRECIDIFHGEISRATITNDLNGLIEFGLIRQEGSSKDTYYEPVH